VPELPEVETIRGDLDGTLRGRRIRRVDARAGRSIRRHPDSADFVAPLVGATVAEVTRRGKYLRFSLDRPVVLVVHLGMSGQLLLSSPGDPEAPHTHVVVTFDGDRFDGDRELRFVDPRTFGEAFVTGTGGSALAHLGPDPLADLKGWKQLADLLRARRSQLKSLLMDQRFLAGIGNLYSDEILFAARLRYDRRSETLTDAEVRRLHRAMTTVLASAIGHRGSSLADEQYRDVFGVIGDFQNHHQVYGRPGEACPRCRTAIVRIKTGGRSTFLCPRCQALG
jgi:formamidopyrimidine-DNA glycosylase